MSPTSERLYPANQSAVMAALLQGLGIPAEEVFRGTGLDTRVIKEATCLTSIDQYQRVCANAISLTPDHSLSFRSGARLHLSDLGIFGVLLLSCQSAGDVPGRGVSQ
jgi:hypothetical protein